MRGHDAGSAGSSYSAHATVSSVGPYVLTIALPGAASRQALAWWYVSCSPMNWLRRRPGIDPAGRPPIRSAVETAEGTENQWVILRRFTYRTGAMSSIDCGITIVAPRAQAQNMSKTDGSKVSSKACERRLSGVIACSAAACST